MRQRKCNYLSYVGALAVGALILDGKTAVNAGVEAVQLCIRVLIPSLFPFFVFSPLLSGGGFGILFRPLRKLLRLPEGAESVLLVSFLGGYPVGAMVTAQRCKDGGLRKADASRMLAFCSNAGPSFLFGIGGQLFPKLWYCWLLWGIHIVSAIFVGLMVPGSGGKMATQKHSDPTLTAALTNAIKVMATVCGWVVIFRVLTAFLDRWLLWYVPIELSIVISSLLELANGCCELGSIEPVGLRMVLFSAMLAFGGLCVWLQTLSVTDNLNRSAYLPGKVTQSGISILFSCLAQPLLPQADRWAVPVWLWAIAVAIFAFGGLFLRKCEKRCGNPVANVV